MNKPNNEQNVSKEEKKGKFDKKKWREKKYSQKYKIEQWEKRREAAALKQYYLELKKDPVYSESLAQRFSKKVENCSKLENDANSTQSSPQNDIKKTHHKKMNSFIAARLEMKRIKEEREKQKEEILKRKKEMSEQLEKYKKKRAERYKILSQKNSKGQPVMKGRLQLLYNHIKETIP